ncbi:MAG: hypothetical protein AAB336_06105 [Acidobacteriota bacterium]
MSLVADETNREKLLQDNLLLLKYKVEEQRLEKVWRQFEEGGFNPILIKGWAAAQKYPNPAERLYVDVDLMFDSEEYSSALEFYLSKSFELTVDLHEGARHLDTLSFKELYQNSILKQCGETSIRILSEEDHLRILCVHWLNDGGGVKNRLWDIYHAVENRYEDFDWSKCLDVVNAKRRRWIITAIGIAHHYLELNISKFPFNEETKKIPKWVFKALEKEWKDEVRLMPLHYYLNDKKQLWKQIKKRIPPNPIQATIDLRGEFDNTPRIFYQIGDVFLRIFPSWKRISKRL